jgi:ribosomal protein S18 acetylase RimI-like enzyme
MHLSAIRAAVPSDVDRLLALEDACFASDRLGARSFRHFVKAPTAALRVIGDGDRIDGYSLLLFRAGSRVARLYSIAVAPEVRGRGLAARLLADAETLARGRNMDRLALEVREDNPAAIGFYERRGYALSGRASGYYEDGADARRYEKRLDRPASRRSRQADD